MDTEKILIYVAIGVVYYGYKYLFKNFGKSQEPPKPILNVPKQQPQEADTWNNPPAKETEQRSSIFDLLEEIRKQEATKKKTSPASYKTLENTDYELEPEKVVIENTDPYKYKATSLKKEQKDPNDKTLLSEEYSIQRKPHPLLSILKDQKKVKEAFIVGEILTKKY